MNKKFIKVEDQDVAVTFVYVNSDGVACEDADGEKTITASNLKHIFYAGCVIVTDDGEYLPVNMTEAEGIVTITYATTDTDSSTSAAIFVPATVESVVDPA